MLERPLCLSIVSHAHGPLVGELLSDLARCDHQRIRVVLTLNIAEDLPVDPARVPFPVSVVRNALPRGFGANHNAAFARGNAEHFGVLNPDLRLPSDPFPALLARLEDPSVAAVAPRVLAPDGAIEDSARLFPTPWSILAKAAGYRGATGARPDWIAGMFMLFRSEAFAAAGGFDERYFMYYEDVDLCARLAKRGLRVEVEPAASVVHDARRASHRNLRHFAWHLRSMLRFFGRRALGKV